MSDYYDAFEMSPVPNAGPETVAPEPYRGIYAMPAFVTIPSSDLSASVDFWTRRLGCIDLFSIPDTIVHLRRWAFQDVLLVPATNTSEQTPDMSLSFSCVMSEIETVLEACRALSPNSATEPRETFWNTRDLEIITPESVRVIFTAAKPYDPDSQEARNLDSMGIPAPEARTRENGGHD